MIWLWNFEKAPLGNLGLRNNFLAGAHGDGNGKEQVSVSDAAGEGGEDPDCLPG